MKYSRQKLERLLHDYVAGDLDDTQRADVEALLERDPKARALHDEIATAHDALVSLRDRPEPPVSARDVLPEIRSAIAAHQFEERPKLYMDGSGRRFYQRVALAATLLLAVTVGLFAWNRGEGGNGVAPDPRVLTPANAPDDEVVGTMDGLAYLEHLKRRGLTEIWITPGVLPVADGAPEKR